MVETIIQFVTTHSEALIAGSFSVILILSGVLIYFNVFVTKPVDPEADFKKIEASIEKLLSKAEFMKAGPSGSAGGDGASADGSAGEGGEVSSADLLELEADLAEKKREIEKLKEELESGGGAGDDNTPELLAKIKNLEDRLAEYEIIEDDIADLSHYKEENAKLKKQLAEGGGAAPAESNPEPVAAVEEPEAVGGAEIVEAKVASEPEMPTEDEAVVAAAEAEAEAKSDDDDIAAALAAVQEEEPAEEVVASAEATPVPESSDVEDFSKAVDDIEAQKVEEQAAAAEPAAAEEKAEGEVAGSDDVFAEMSDSGDESDDPLAALGDIDTNKMLEELQGLEEGANADSDVLTEQTDVDKMADEAEDLEKKS